MNACVATLPDLIRDRVLVADNGCWLWQHHKTQGYGQVWVPALKKLRLVHVLSFETASGPIPDGHDVGHLCHDRDLSCAGGATCKHRACCNPAHLGAQTRRENNLGGRLGDAQRARHAIVTHCPSGHAYDVANTYQRHDRDAGGRMCQTCSRERMRARRAAAREDIRAAFGNVDPDTGEIRGDQ